MIDRPILRFPKPTNSTRRTGSSSVPPRPRGPGRRIQTVRFQNTFDRVEAALQDADPEFVLRQDPAGVAPERALVFVTAGSIQDFTRVAREIGLQVFAEIDLEATEAFPDGFEPTGGQDALPRTLYATMPTLDAFQRLLSLWRAYDRSEPAPHGAGPWWNLFDLMLELRRWGPEDRLSGGARAAIEDRLQFDENDHVSIEFEIWPDWNTEKRAAWRVETERRIAEVGGRVLDRSSISETGFTYEAVLASLPVGAVRLMLDHSHRLEGLVSLEGVQFILPQTIGQAEPGGPDPDGEAGEHEPKTGFSPDAPMRGALLDGTPVAGHPALDGGLVIEDVHDLVRLSPVDQRHHATAMASLILRGDLDADGEGLQDARIVSVPLLIDSASGPSSPEDRLFVDLMHTALLTILGADEPLAKDVFVVNFAIGLKDVRFGGRISALARLMDWWAEKEGILFVISAGNIPEGLALTGVSASMFERMGSGQRREIIRSSLRSATFDRTLLAPAECLNGIAVGALSKDLSDHSPPEQAGIITLEDHTETLPQITSALGLGPHRTMKPDLLGIGGQQEIRAWPSGNDIRLRPLYGSYRRGLVVAAPVDESRTTQKSVGTSAAAALVTRAILRSAEDLTGEDGPYEGQELSRRDLALLTRALAINSARWPENAVRLYEEERQRLGSQHHVRAKEEVCRHFGHGVLVPDLMQRSPDTGVTLVGLGSVRKDQARIFHMPLPPSLSGDRVPRSMRVTLAWFSPVDAARAQYRLAGLEAVAADEGDGQHDKKWRLELRSSSSAPDANMVRRGSVWSQRLIQRVNRVPTFADGDHIPICVQCRDTAGGALNPDEDIAFAIAVTLEVEVDVQYDIHAEVEEQVRLRLLGGA